jgi:hypothetical protein
MNALTRRLEALEHAANALAPLPCHDCGLGHFYDVLTLERLQARYAGSAERLPATCACGCCAPILDDLRARLAHVGGAA